LTPDFSFEPFALCSRRRLPARRSIARDGAAATDRSPPRTPEQWINQFMQVIQRINQFMQVIQRINQFMQVIQHIYQLMQVTEKKFSFFSFKFGVLDLGRLVGLVVPVKTWANDE
jgi:hypothetical protein